MNIVIYVEGGGNSADQRKEIRYAFQALIEPERKRAREQGYGFQILPCGGRQQTFDRFNEYHDRDSVALLLVDSEDPIACGPDAVLDGAVRKQHLIERDKWASLASCDGINIHLMTQTMETWIVADPEGLQKFYGNGFLPTKLPRRQDLEEHAKSDVALDLAAATAKTSKRSYHKINHVRGIFECLDRSKIETKCRRFAFFVARLDQLLKPPHA